MGGLAAVESERRGIHKSRLAKAPAGQRVRLREHLDALESAPRAEFLHVLPDLERAERIGELWGQPETRGFRERRTADRA